MYNSKYRVSLPFWLVTLSIVFGLTLPVLIQDAMFQDAMLYSCVSHNLGIGIGNFWFLQYSALNLEGISSFHEQPPLVFGIQSIFYKILGDSMYIERLYTFLMIVLHIILINKLWLEIFKNKVDYKRLGWLPVLFWILIPVCFWSFRNNMIENTVSIFTLCSIIISYQVIQSQKNNFLIWISSGFFIFLATFSKGIPGFFPITFPILYWIITRKISFKKSLFYTLILLSVPVLFYSFFMINPESRQSLSIYFFERLIRRVNTMPSTDNRLEIVWRLFMELVPIIIITCTTIILAKRKKIITKISENFKTFLLFIVIGLAGSLPLILTMVQKGWYMVPSFPYFAIAFSIIITPAISYWVNKINTQGIKYKVFMYTSIFLLISVFTYTFMQKGKISREVDTVSDVYKIGEVVPKFSVITVPDEMYHQYDFILQGFLVRYFNISISPYKEFQYYLKEKKVTSIIPDNYEKIEIDLVKYDLYKIQTVRK